MRASFNGPSRTLAALAALAMLALAHGPVHAQTGEQPKDTPADADSTPRKAGLRTTQMCIDREIADRLALKRKRRGAVDRLFVKQARHEITAMGGYYSSDLFSGTYVTGGSYTYHMTEDTAVEFGAALTHANADLIRAIEDGRASILDDDFARVLLIESLLVWSPVYGKLRLGGTIMRFDINLGAGVGVVDSQTSRGAAGVAGVGMKLFIGKALALRIDARNHVFRQEILDERFLVNDVAVTTGLSLFLPLRN
jgi:outer membrane beta-barrel protein